MSSDSVTITPEDTNLAGGNKRAILDKSFDQVTSPNRVVRPSARIQNMSLALPILLTIP